MRIIISNTSDAPIYAQIAAQIKDMALREELRPGEALPSIRSLAKDLQVSVITTKRAYEELEREGFIETVGGKGTFIAHLNRERLREQKLHRVETLFAAAVEECLALGVTEAEAHTILELLFRGDK